MAQDLLKHRDDLLFTLLWEYANRSRFFSNIQNGKKTETKESLEQLTLSQLIFICYLDN
jgi:hypothetical protein